MALHVSNAAMCMTLLFSIWHPVAGMRLGAVGRGSMDYGPCLNLGFIQQAVADLTQRSYQGDFGSSAQLRFNAGLFSESWSW